MAIIKSKEQSLKYRLGSDLKLPIENTFEPVAGLDLLVQDIQQLLLTIPGERPFRPQFGCELRSQIWENMDQAEIDGRASISTAIENFEPRVMLEAVDSERNDSTGLITFYIKFIVLGTNTSVNLVFPFRSGSELSLA